MKNNSKQIVAVIGVLGMFCVASTPTIAAGFRLPEVSASSVAMGITGVAGQETAAAAYMNPALLPTLAGTQLEIGTTLIQPSGTVNFAGITTDQDKQVFYPSFLHATHSYNEHFGVGLAFTTPFGLGTSYPYDWNLRGESIKADLQAYNITLAAGMRLNKLSFGIGVDYMRSTVAIIRGLDLTAVGGSNKDVLSLSGLGSNWGARVGTTYQINDELRLGITYRSSISIDYSGSANFITNAKTLFPDQDVKASLKMPDVMILGLSWRKGDTRIEFDADWTKWSTYKDLTLDFAVGSPVGVSKKSTSIKNWKNVWAYRLGAEHKLASGWLLRGGIALDQSPIPDATLDALLPGADRIMLSVGTSLPALGGTIDVGFLHMMFANRTSTKPGVAADYKSSAELLSLSYSYKL
ncbi:MAG: outer membrane protein transport protein [Mariprofundales bacterium]